MIFGEGNKSVFLQGHRIGTCGQPIDQLAIELGRVRAVPRLIVAFDGTRNGWSIGGSFRNAEGDDFEFRELTFIPEQDFNEDRFQTLAAN